MSRIAYGPISGAVGVWMVRWIIPERSNARLAGFRVTVLVEMGLAGDDLAMASNDRFTDPVQMTSTVADPDDPEYQRGHVDATAGKPRGGYTGQYHKGYDDGLSDNFITEAH